MQALFQRARGKGIVGEDSLPGLSQAADLTSCFNDNLLVLLSFRLHTMKRLIFLH